MNQLRECPFCGDNSSIECNWGLNDNDYVYISCKCGIKFESYSFDMDSTIEAWNTRATDKRENDMKFKDIKERMEEYHIAKPKFTKGQRLNSMRGVYEACLGGYEVINHCGRIFRFDEQLGIIDQLRNNSFLFDECERWEILE